MSNRDCLDKNVLNSYIDLLHNMYKPKSAKRKIVCVKAFYRCMEIEDIIDFNPFHKIFLKYKEPLKLPRTIPLDLVKKILVYSYKQRSVANTKYRKNNFEKSFNS